MSSKDKDSKMSRFEELDPDQFANWKHTKDSIGHCRGVLNYGLRPGKTLKAAQSSMSKAVKALEGLDHHQSQRFIWII